MGAEQQLRIRGYLARIKKLEKGWENYYADQERLNVQDARIKALEKRNAELEDMVRRYMDPSEAALAGKGGKEPTTLYSGAESVREHARKVALAEKREDRATLPSGDEDTSDDAQRPGSPRGNC